MRRRAEMRSSLTFVVLNLAVLTAGCFKYTHIQPALAPVGSEVRVHLSEPGFTRLSAAVAEEFPRLGRTIEGELVLSSQDKLLVALRVPTDRAATRDALKQRVDIPLGDISQMELKQLNKRNLTLISIGVGVVLGAFVAHWLSGVFGGTTGPVPEPGPGEFAPPTLRLSPARNR